ncbi:MAG: F0F1 ATP synthase subunit B [Alphaproteobacteria bacterium]|nr:F0F1 ATP synthase subunit B [Alphaproteobacteria bacterium]
MFSSPEFWVLAAFVIFFALLGKKLFGLIGGALDDRAGKIRGQLDEAEKLKRDAEAALAEYRRKQRDGLKEAEAILALGRAAAQTLEAEQKAQIEQRLKRREAQAVDKIAQAEAQAIAEVRNAAVDLALAATRRVLTEKVDAIMAAGLVDASIKELPRHLRA